MCSKVILANTPDETEEIAMQFAEWLRGGDKVGLCGSLGAGKTRFMQGVSATLLDGAPLPSPTFAIVQDYPLKDGGTLFHMDLYRLDTWTSFLEIDGQGLIDRLDSKSFLFVEWADRYPELVLQLNWLVHVREKEADNREIEMIYRHPGLDHRACPGFNPGGGQFSGCRIKSGMTNFGSGYAGVGGYRDGFWH